MLADDAARGFSLDSFGRNKSNWVTEMTTKTLHTIRFPAESAEYRAARDKLLEAEVALRATTEAVAAQRRSLPLGGDLLEDYVFDQWDAQEHDVRQVRLSELFAPGTDTLFLYSFMFNPGPEGTPLDVGCPSCTSIIDAVDGSARHVMQRISFAVEAKTSVERFEAHARTRGWRHARLLSSAGNTYRHDYNCEQSDADQWPIATVFVRRGDRIHHWWSSELFYVPPEAGMDMRHVDFMWPMWAIFDTTPSGRGDWSPELTYR